MQPLTPPENVALSGLEVNTRRLHQNPMRDRTGSRTPQRAIQLGHSFRTNAPVGNRERLDPKDPGSCHVNNGMSALSRMWRREHAQVVSPHRDKDRSSFGDGQFGIHPPGGTNNWFRERQDVVVVRCARHLYHDGMNPQRFLCVVRMNAQV